MSPKRYAMCAVLAGVVAYAAIDLGCDGNGTPVPFPIPDAGGIHGPGPGGNDGGPPPGDAQMYDAFQPQHDAGTFPGDGGF